MRTCNKCGEEKAETEFSVYTNACGWKGLRRACKACERKRYAEYDKARDKIARQEQARKRNNQRDVFGFTRYKRGDLAVYGLTPRMYLARLDKQKGLCACCGDGISQETAQIDHCHSTGRTRDLLCQGCNRGLGLFRDDPNRLRKAIEYLKRHSSVTLRVIK